MYNPAVGGAFPLLFGINGQIWVPPQRCERMLQHPTGRELAELWGVHPSPPALHTRPYGPGGGGKAVRAPKSRGRWEGGGAGGSLCVWAGFGGD